MKGGVDVARIPLLLEKEVCQGTDWFNLRELSQMLPREIASRAYWEAETTRANMSPLMWVLEFRYGGELAAYRHQAEIAHGRPLPSGCFLSLKLVGAAKAQQEKYANKLWEKAFIEAHSNTLGFLRDLARQRYETAHFLFPDSKETLALHDLWRLLKSKAG